MKRKVKALSSLVICTAMVGLLVPSSPVNAEVVSAQSYNTEIEYQTSTQETWNLTVPVSMHPGETAPVTLEGQFPANKTINVTADKTVTLNNQLMTNDSKTLGVTFPGITLAGSNSQAVKSVANVSVEDMMALFGKYDGRFNYNVSSSTAYVSVAAKDKNGQDLNATASTIEGEQKTKLLNQLKESKLIGDNEKVDALIEVKADSFTDLADTTFNVSNIAKPGDSVAILHYNHDGKWELINKDTVKTDGTVTGKFSSYSPVAFVVTRADGTQEVQKYGGYDNNTGKTKSATPTSLIPQNKTEALKIGSCTGQGDVWNMFDYNTGEPDINRESSYASYTDLRGSQYAGFKFNEPKNIVSITGIYSAKYTYLNASYIELYDNNGTLIKKIPGFSSSTFYVRSSTIMINQSNVSEVRIVSDSSAKSAPHLYNVSILGN